MRFSPFQRPEHSLNDHLRNRRWGETNKTSSRGWLRTSKDDKDCDSGRIICNWSIHYTLPCYNFEGSQPNLADLQARAPKHFLPAWAAKHKHILLCRWLNRDRFASWLEQNRTNGQLKTETHMEKLWGPQLIQLCLHVFIVHLEVYSFLRCFLLAMPVGCCTSCSTWQAMDWAAPTTLSKKIV